MGGPMESCFYSYCGFIVRMWFIKNVVMTVTVIHKVQAATHMALWKTVVSMIIILKYCQIHRSDIYNHICSRL